MPVVRYHQKSQRRWTTSKFRTIASAKSYGTTLPELLLVFRVEATDVLRAIHTSIVFEICSEPAYRFVHAKHVVPVELTLTINSGSGIRRVIMDPVTL